MNDEKWIEYYKATTKKSKPRNTLLQAIDFFDRENRDPKLAIDLGCGAGLDSLALLNSGWTVIAIDSQPAAISNLLAITPTIVHHRLSAEVVFFETIHYLPESHLINASFSLPFLARQQFYKFWAVIENSVYPDGRFSGTFFGEKDGWKSRADMTFLTLEELRHLFARFNIEWFEEEETVHPDAAGYEKFWHKYFVVAKKVL